MTFAANAIDTVSQAIRRHRKRELEKHVLMQFGRQGADSARTDAGLTAYDFEQLQVREPHLLTPTPRPNPLCATGPWDGCWPAGLQIARAGSEGAVAWLGAALGQRRP